MPERLWRHAFSKALSPAVSQMEKSKPGDCRCRGFCSSSASRSFSPLPSTHAYAFGQALELPADTVLQHIVVLIQGIKHEWCHNISDGLNIAEVGIG